MSQNIYLNELKDFRKPGSVLIQGLPGLGFVGKIAIDFLIDQLKPTKLAELYSTYIDAPARAGRRSCSGGLRARGCARPA
ncbi:PAC2 family protein [Candidatus Bathyarchaeota archaeon]|nr:PAC2 family protein [Candidatus Bathyarchaeota archaeon]